MISRAPGRRDLWFALGTAVALWNAPSESSARPAERSGGTVASSAGGAGVGNAGAGDARSNDGSSDAASPGGRQPKRAVLRLVAPEECAGPEELEARVQRRSREIRFVPAPADHEAAIRIERARAKLHATLTLRLPGEPTRRRSIVADGCDEAFDALALMIVIAFDPEAALTGWESADEAADPFASPDTPAASRESSREAFEPSRGSEGPPMSPRSSGDEEPVEDAGASAESPEARAPKASRWFASAGGGLFVQGALAPEMLWGPEIALGVHWQRPSLWAPTLRLSGARAVRDDLREVGGVASFQLTALTLDLCPALLQHGTFALRPCGFVQGGRVVARGTETFEPREAQRPWWVAGVSAVLSWEPTAFVALLAVARLGRPGVRDTFEFEPLVFHSVPPWAPSASVGLEVRFP